MDRICDDILQVQTVYVRRVAVRASDGTPREYLQLQESYRQHLPDS